MFLSPVCGADRADECGEAILPRVRRAVEIGDARGLTITALSPPSPPLLPLSVTNAPVQSHTLNPTRVE